MDIKQFEVISEGQELRFDIQIPDTLEFEFIAIQKIAIQDHKHYTPSFPEAPQVLIEVDDIYTEGKSFSKTIQISETSLSQTGLYFLYVACIDYRTAPHTLKESPEKAGAVDLFPLYNKASKLIAKSLSNCGERREELLDIYLQQQMMLQALNLEQYQTAIAIFENLFIKSTGGKCLDLCNGSPAYSSLSFPTTSC